MSSLICSWIPEFSVNRRDMAFKYPNERPPFSANPIPGSIASVLVERETREIGTKGTEQQFERIKGRVTRDVVGAFWDDMAEICSAAVAQSSPQHPLHAEYRRAAERNRNFIAEARRRERGERDRELERLAA